MIGVHGTGTDPVAVPEATRAGIPVVNTPGANAHRRRARDRVIFA